MHTYDANSIDKLIEDWETLHHRCVETYKKKPNDFLDGFMSSLLIRIAEIKKIREQS